MSSEPPAGIVDVRTNSLPPIEVGMGGPKLAVGQPSWLKAAEAAVVESIAPMKDEALSDMPITIRQ